MSEDRQTLDFYDRAAGDYADRCTNGRPDADLLAFVGALPPGARVLDLGCGPGRSAAHFRDAGFQVDATDASEGMLRTARERHGIDARYATFDMLDAVAAYDGVWANFSLLHAPRSALPGHLARVHRALGPGGLFHIAMKTGSGARRDALGRHYTYYAIDELAALIADAGFTEAARRTGSGPGMAGADEPFVIMRAHA